MRFATVAVVIIVLFAASAATGQTPPSVANPAFPVAADAVAWYAQSWFLISLAVLAAGGAVAGAALFSARRIHSRLNALARRTSQDLQSARDGISRDLETVRAGLGGIGKDVVQVTRSVTALEGSVGAVQKSIGGLSGSFSRMDAAMSQVRGDQENLRMQVSAGNPDLEDLARAVQGIELIRQIRPDLAPAELAGTAEQFRAILEKCKFTRAREPSTETPVPAAFSRAAAPAADGWALDGRSVPPVRLAPKFDLDRVRLVIGDLQQQARVATPVQVRATFLSESEVAAVSHATGLLIEAEANRAGLLPHAAVQAFDCEPFAALEACRRWLQEELAGLWLADPAASAPARRLVAGFSPSGTHQHKDLPGLRCKALDAALPPLQIWWAKYPAIVRWWRDENGPAQLYNAGAAPEDVTHVGVQMSSLTRDWLGSYQQQEKSGERRLQIITTWANLLLDARASVLRRALDAGALGPSAFEAWDGMLQAIGQDLAMVKMRLARDDEITALAPADLRRVSRPWAVPASALSVPAGAADVRRTATRRWLRPLLVRADAEAPACAAGAEIVSPELVRSSLRAPVTCLLWAGTVPWQPETWQLIAGMMRAVADIEESRPRQGEKPGGALRKTVIENYWKPLYALANDRLGLSAPLNSECRAWIETVNQALSIAQLQCAVNETRSQYFQEALPGEGPQFRPPLVESGTDCLMCIGVRPGRSARPVATAAPASGSAVPTGDPVASGHSAMPAPLQSAAQPVKEAAPAKSGPAEPAELLPMNTRQSTGVVAPRDEDNRNGSGGGDETEAAEMVFIGNPGDASRDQPLRDRPADSVPPLAASVLFTAGPPIVAPLNAGASHIMDATSTANPHPVAALLGSGEQAGSVFELMVVELARAADKRGLFKLRENEFDTVYRAAQEIGKRRRKLGQTESMTDNTLKEEVARRYWAPACRLAEVAYDLRSTSVKRDDWWRNLKQAVATVGLEVRTSDVGGELELVDHVSKVPLASVPQPA